MRGRPPSVCDCVCGGKARLRKGEVGWYVRCERDPGFASAPEYSTPKRAANAWNKEQGQMDQLTLDAVCAYHNGKSYGKYIAGIPIEPPTERFPKKAAAEPPEIRCVCCGLLIPEGSRSKRYCSPACAERYREKTIPQSAAPTAPFTQGSQERMEVDAADERPKCLECGKPLPLASRKTKYCSGVCADKAMVRQKAASAKRISSRGGAR